MTRQEAAAIVKRVFTSHGLVGMMITPTQMFAAAKDIRAEFEAAGADWEQLAGHITGTVDALGRDPQLTAEQFAAVRQALCDGFNVTLDVDVSADRLSATYNVTDLKGRA